MEGSSFSLFSIHLVSSPLVLWLFLDSLIGKIQEKKDKKERLEQ